MAPINLSGTYFLGGGGRKNYAPLNMKSISLVSQMANIILSYLIEPFKYEAQTALVKDPVRTAQ